METDAAALSRSIGGSALVMKSSDALPFRRLYKGRGRLEHVFCFTDSGTKRPSHLVRPMQFCGAVRDGSMGVETNFHDYPPKDGLR